MQEPAGRTAGETLMLHRKMKDYGRFGEIAFPHRAARDSYAAKRSRDYADAAKAVPKTLKGSGMFWTDSDPVRWVRKVSLNWGRTQFGWKGRPEVNGDFSSALAAGSSVRMREYQDRKREVRSDELS